MIVSRSIDRRVVLSDREPAKAQQVSFLSIWIRRRREQREALPTASVDRKAVQLGGAHHARDRTSRWLLEANGIAFVWIREDSNRCFCARNLQSDV